MANLREMTPPTTGVESEGQLSCDEYIQTWFNESRKTHVQKLGIDPDITSRMNEHLDSCTDPRCNCLPNFEPNLRRATDSDQAEAVLEIARREIENLEEELPRAA